MAAVADVPSTVPALTTTEVDVLNGASPANGTIPTQGLDGSTLDVKPVATASALPRVGGDATIVDLSLLGRLQSAPTIVDATDQVWLGPAAPADALARLQAAGLRVDGTQTASAVLQQAQRSGPALADDFLLVATIVALLAAAASTLGTLGTTARQRATELAAFEVSGVSRRALAGSLAVEAGVLAVTTISGAAAGVLAAAMAVPSLPELAGAAPIPLQYHLPAGLLAAVSGAVLIAVLVSCAAVAAVLVTRTSPSLLRTAPDDTAA
jgi:putative ABC transport system permease protein